MREALLQNAQQQFSATRFIDDIARVSGPEGRDGRECHAFSAEEDAAFDVTEQAARNILSEHKEGTDYNMQKDAIGNMFIRFFGNERDSKCIMIGSHVDSVTNGGKYDGVAGVAMALETLEAVAVSGKKPRRDLVVAVWRSEESSPKNSFGCLGSSVATGLITTEQASSILYDRAANVKLSEHFSKRYGKERWGNVLKQIETPNIHPRSVGAYFEAHIEQSAVIDTKEKDMGVVVGGIGGARRDRIETKLEPKALPVQKGQYRKVTLRFLGEPDHTGGTPPNPSFFKAPGITWYRKDALVASCVAANKLLRDSDVHLLGSQPQRPTGFTSLPSYQLIELLVPKEKWTVVRSDLQDLKRVSNEALGVDLRYSSEEYTESSAKVVSRENARALLDVPQIVSVLGTEAFEKQGTETGTTRATVVDYYLSPGSIAYNLDLREVNEQDITRLIDEIHKHTDLILGKGAYKTISVKTHSPVDAEMSSRLQKHANQLGLTFVLMPSMPGHDADRISAAGIPTAMVFIRHDGKSHNPNEAMAAKDFDKAASVMKGTVFQMLHE